MISPKSYLKRYKFLYSIIKVIKSDFNLLNSGFYRIWWSIERIPKIKKYMTNHNIKKLHLGCGPMILDGWLNTDLNLRSKEIVFLDITEPLPFSENTFDFIYSEHLIEHVSLDDAIFHLQECCRVLKSCGVLRIATPDLSFLLDYFYHKEHTPVQKAYIKKVIDENHAELGFYHGTILLNRFLRDWGHQFVYDFNVLEHILRKAGFNEFRPCKICESIFPELRGLESHGTAISAEFNNLQTMVTEAVKSPQER